MTRKLTVSARDLQVESQAGEPCKEMRVRDHLLGQPNAWLRNCALDERPGEFARAGSRGVGLPPSGETDTRLPASSLSAYEQGELITRSREALESVDHTSCALPRVMTFEPVRDLAARQK